MNHSATIYDVARESAVSIATVSRVMNHPERVAPATRARILSVMNRLDFSPSVEAAIRARSNLRRIGVVAPHAWSYSFMERIRGLAGALSALEYELITYSVEEGMQLGNYLSMLSTGDRVDGVVMMALPVDAEALCLFRRRGIPLVFVESRMEEFPSIVTDNREGGALAARCLLERGYRRPAFLGEGGSEDYLIDSSGSRLAGFRSQLSEAGVSLEASTVFLHYGGYRHILSAVEQLLSARPFPDAVFTASDYEAMVLCRTARERGMRIPGDLAVLGYDNIEAARFIGLSTIDQHLEESGRLAGEYINLAFRGDYTGIPELTRLPVELVERETV